MLDSDCGFTSNALSSCMLVLLISSSISFNSSEADVDPTHQDFFPYWAFMVTALLLYIVNFIHLFMNHGVTQCFVSSSTGSLCVLEPMK